MTAIDATSAPPRLSTGPLGIAVRVVVAVAALLASNLAVGGVLGALGALGFGSDPSWVTVGMLVGAQAMSTVVALLVVWAWVRLVERRTLRSTLWRWDARTVPALLVGMLAAGGTVVAATAMLPATGPVAMLDNGGLPFVATLTVLASQAFLLQAVPEELLFRGWLLTSMRARPVLAVVVTTLAFTVIHLVSSGGQQSALEHVLYLTLPFGFSLLAVGLLLWTRSLWAAIGVHGGFHLGNALAQATLPAVDAPLSWLTIGGAQAVLGAALVVVALARGRGVPD